MTRPVYLRARWAFRELFDTETEAARAYDDAVWRLKPREATSYVNFKGASDSPHHQDSTAGISDDPFYDGSSPSGHAFLKSEVCLSCSY